MVRKCARPSCRKHAMKHRRICSMHKKREARMRHPWKAAYQMHKDNALRRLKYLPRDQRFKLSFAEFMAIWEKEPEKMAEKARCMRGESETKCSWEIDRIDNHKGYEAGNCRLVTKSVNVKSYHAFMRGEGDFQISVTKITPEDLQELRNEVPF